jgi:Kef-type K+ transport system membrane component KefB
MAIDGRQIGRPPEEKDASQSFGVRAAAVLIVVVPAVGLVALAYLIGTWTGGFLGGVLSVASTALTVAVLWVFMRRRRR